MDTHTHLEDLSNEIFYEICDYLHALDIFTAFTSLNTRISSILQSIPLHVIILQTHINQEIDFLSSHLTLHADQVISLTINDTIYDHLSIINLLFERHQFINLQSCMFKTLNPSTKFENVIKQLQSLNKLVSFFIVQPSDNIDVKDKCDLTRTILTHKSTSLRSAMLHYDYDYLDISTYTSIASNLISLHLSLSGSVDVVSVYSVLPILRVCHRLKYLRTIITHKNLPSNYQNVSIEPPSVTSNDFPISTQVTSFYLSIHCICDMRSLVYVLACMRNLIYFKFLHGLRKVAWPFDNNLANGYVWQKLLERIVPNLCKFDFYILLAKRFPKLDLNVVTNSFDYFVKKYSNWHMIIDRWVPDSKFPEEVVTLRTLAFHKHKTNLRLPLPLIHCESFETRSTNTTTNDHYLYYADIKYLKLDMRTITPRTTCSIPLFQNINSIVIHMQSISSLSSNDASNTVNCVQSNDNDDSQQCVTYLSHFVHLPNVHDITILSHTDKCGWKDIQFILQACPKVIHLGISASYLVLSEFIDNQSLISIFKQIKILISVMKDHYFPSNFASKLVERFPSLTRIELRVFLFDDCISAIDILLGHLNNLSYLKINCEQISLRDHPFSRNYIIDKRREAFPLNIIDEHKVIVRKFENAIDIRLS